MYAERQLWGQLGFPSKRLPRTSAVTVAEGLVDDPSAIPTFEYKRSARSGGAWNSLLSLISTWRWQQQQKREYNQQEGLEVQPAAHSHWASAAVAAVLVVVPLAGEHSAYASTGCTCIKVDIAASSWHFPQLTSLSWLHAAWQALPAWRRHLQKAQRPARISRARQPSGPAPPLQQRGRKQAGGQRTQDARGQQEPAAATPGAAMSRSCSRAGTTPEPAVGAPPASHPHDLHRPASSSRRPASAASQAGVVEQPAAAAAAHEPQPEARHEPEAPPTAAAVEGQRVRRRRRQKQQQQPPVPPPPAQAGRLDATARQRGSSSASTEAAAAAAGLSAAAAASTAAAAVDAAEHATVTDFKGPAAGEPSSAAAWAPAVPELVAAPATVPGGAATVPEWEGPEASQAQPPPLHAPPLSLHQAAAAMLPAEAVASRQPAVAARAEPGAAGAAVGAASSAAGSASGMQAGGHGEGEGGEGEEECVVCWEEERRVVLVPCGHLVLCKRACRPARMGGLLLPGLGTRHGCATGRCCGGDARDESPPVPCPRLLLPQALRRRVDGGGGAAVPDVPAAGWLRADCVHVRGVHTRCRGAVGQGQGQRTVWLACMHGIIDRQACLRVLQRGITLALLRIW